MARLRTTLFPYEFALTSQEQGGGSLMLTHAGTDFQVTVTTTATLIRENPSAAIEGALRHLLTIRNTSSDTVLYFGSDSGVTAGGGRGFPLNPGESYDIEAHVDVWGIVASGSAVVAGWEETV